ncbi:amidohydrolase family protein [Aminobacter sp. AP02]|uniref:amidohydrolase family protein n=1 Tax=Aminobacter sp. AP02 TaxID=2135737 RepID=UPI000D6BAC6B|nr:amidohydrolase family protein [Aminobacter sp. AP02]PWK60780.1 cytosine/adenosine deaminase-related metal-dependent hydrolase [Aminobacter sp. AP02]
MENRKTVITGGFVVTMDEVLKDLPQGAILIEGDQILKVASDRSEFDGIDAELIDAEGGIIIPGIIDTHRHTWMALFRAVSADMSLPEFLASTFYGWGSLVTAEVMGAATMVGALEAIDSGVTTIFDCCDCVNSPDHARAAVDSLRASGIRAIYAYGMQKFDFKPTAFKAHEQRLVDARALRSNELSNTDDLVGMGMLLTDFGILPFDETASEFRLGHELGLKLASHTGAASTSILLKGLRELNDRKLLRPGHLHIHCNGLTPPEWELIAKTDGKVSISPETEMQMGMGFPPFRTCLNHGISPSFSTDIVCVGSGDLFSQMRLGLQFQRCIDNDHVHKHVGRMPYEINLSVRDALTWATVNGADALGLAKSVGSITPGKKADITIVSGRRHFVPTCHPIGSVVLQSTAADVDTVIVDGVVRKRHGKLVGQDLERIRARANDALRYVQKEAEKLPNYNPTDIANWFEQAERMASVHFAQAYASS